MVEADARSLDALALYANRSEDAFVIVFAGGNYLDWFPLRGIVSENFSDLSWYEQIYDYLWHMALPLLAMVIGGFATLTMLSSAPLRL